MFCYCSFLFLILSQSWEQAFRDFWALLLYACLRLAWVGGRSPLCCRVMISNLVVQLDGRVDGMRFFRKIFFLFSNNLILRVCFSLLKQEPAFGYPNLLMYKVALWGFITKAVYKQYAFLAANGKYGPRVQDEPCILDFWFGHCLTWI